MRDTGLRIIKLIISGGYWALVRPFRRLLSRGQGPSYLIIYYHSLPAEDLPRFTWQLDYLTRKTTPVPLGFRGPFGPRARHTAVTVDDAFQSMIERGAPEMAKRGIPFTIFVTTDYLGRDPGWLEDPGRRGSRDTVATIESLRAIPPEVVTFGSHTLSHPHLPRLPGDEAAREIRESKSVLEKLLDRPIDHLSFPFGDFSPEVVEICRDAGYAQVFTSVFEPASSPANAYAKGRTCVNPWDWTLEFRLKLLGCYAWMPRASALKKGIRRAFSSF